MSSRERGQDDAHELFGYVAAGIAVAILVVYVAPAIGIGIACGSLAGAGATWRPDDPGSVWCKLTAAKMIFAGIALLATYVLTRSVLGADGANRGLSREWGMGRSDLSAFLHHPWAWVPVASGIASMVTGAILWWRSR